MTQQIYTDSLHTVWISKCKSCAGRKHTHTWSFTDCSLFYVTEPWLSIAACVCACFHPRAPVLTKKWCQGETWTSTDTRWRQSLPPSLLLCILFHSVSHTNSSIHLPLLLLHLSLTDLQLSSSVFSLSFFLTSVVTPQTQGINYQLHPHKHVQKCGTHTTLAHSQVWGVC